MRTDVAVIDSSFGIKWFRSEEGTEAADELLVRQARGDVTICMPSHVLHEILGVVRRERGVAHLVEAHQRLMLAGIAIRRLDLELLLAAVEECDYLHCSFYDSLAPALASLLDAPLYSADRRAHADYPGVVLLG